MIAPNIGGYANEDFWESHQSSPDLRIVGHRVMAEGRTKHHLTGSTKYCTRSMLYRWRIQSPNIGSLWAAACLWAMWKDSYTWWYLRIQLKHNIVLLLSTIIIIPVVQCTCLQLIYCINIMATERFIVLILSFLISVMMNYHSQLYLIKCVYTPFCICISNGLFDM